MDHLIQKLRTPLLVMLHDMSMIPLAWLGAYWLRFNLGPLPTQMFTSALQLLPWVIVAQTATFYHFRLYRGVWRFASLPDFLQIGKAVIIGSALITLGCFAYDRLESLPRSVPFIYAALLPLLIGGPRLLYRDWKDRISLPSNRKRALVVGAGKAGEILIADLLSDASAEYHPVILADDDPRKQGREIHGIRVVGGCRRIPKIVRKYRIDTILLAVPSASDRQMRRIIDFCEQSGASFLTLPSPKEILSHPVSGKDLRRVSIEDLLGRKPGQLDWAAIHDHLYGKTLLVTGGGGSIGSELCRQLASLTPESLIIFDSCEYNLFRIEKALQQNFPRLQVIPLLGNVTDPDAVRHVMDTYRPQTVFHAAAYKHVPLLEKQSRQAIHNNIIGTQTVAEASIATGVDEFVLISTDKAVNPGNVMGATKRAAEMICQSLNELNKTRFVIVRFGNVLDSAGSVVPLFRQQIQTGGPVTVTHPEITRYFMTIPEACQLIMLAASVGNGGEIFVLDMGDPIRISYLAEQMIRLSGKRPEIDIKIEYIGLRPGEKLHEELFHHEEQLSSTPYAKLRLAHPRACDRRIIANIINQMMMACRRHDEEQLLILLRTLVPEFHYLSQPSELSHPQDIPSSRTM